MAELFEKYSIAGIETKNRIAAGPMARGVAGDGGSIPDNLIGIYRELAEGGVGMMITEVVLVSDHDPGFIGTPFLRLSTDTHLDDYKTLAETAHVNGVPILPQLGVLSYHRDLPDGRTERAEESELTKEEIDGIVTDFADAAYRAKECGFDGVELHAAHGFLLAHFLSPQYNHRSDEYGGSAENRARIICRIVKAIRERCGDFPVFAKVNCKERQANDPGYTDALDACRELAKAGIDALDVSALDSMPIGIKAGRNEGCFAPFAKLLKENLDVAVLLSGGNRSMEHMQKLLDENACDMLVMARPLIREPGLPARWASGKTSPSDCRSCNMCRSEYERRCFFGTRNRV